MQPAICKTCSTSFTGQYCPKCGQRVIEGFTVSYLWDQFHGEVLEVDRGLWRTVKDLTLRPGHMIRDYLSGKTKIYYSPLKYLLLWVGVFVLLMAAGTYFNKDAFPDFREVFKQPESPANSVQTIAGELMALIFANITLYFLLVIPFLAVGLRIMFRQLSVVEHCMTLAYVWGHVFALLLPIALVTVSLLQLSEWLRAPWLAAFAPFASVIFLYLYFAITYQQLTSGRYLRTLLKLIAAIFLGYTMFMIVTVSVFLTVKSIFGN